MYYFYRVRLLRSFGYDIMDAGARIWEKILNFMNMSLATHYLH